VVIAKHFVVEITAKARRVLKPIFYYAPVNAGAYAPINAGAIAAHHRDTNGNWQLPHCTPLRPCGLLLAPLLPVAALSTAAAAVADLQLLLQQSTATG
jgi:hypothetical protein